MRRMFVDGNGSHGVSRRSFLTLAASGMALTAGTIAAHARTAKPIRPMDDYAIEKLDGVRFSQSHQISNKWLPMKPGTRYTYEGTTVEDDGKVVPHKIILNITDLVKDIGGITSLVSYDLDYSDNELAEAELAFFAQDDNGNVWRFGEYPEEYEDGKFKRAPAWIHGYEGAHAGIMMKAAPKLGTPSYSQGYGPKVNWTDQGMIYKMGLEIAVPHGQYKDVMVIRETSRSEIDAFQLKYYSEGVGNIKVGWEGTGEKSKETVELTKVETLSAKEIVTIRNKALALEKSAYRRGNTAYAPTPKSRILMTGPTAR